MAHEIETTAFYGERPWHGLGTALDESDLYDWHSAAKKAGLDWEVELVPLATADTQVKVESRAVRRSSDGKILGVVGSRYHPLQNGEAFAWFQPFLAAKEASQTLIEPMRQRPSKGDSGFGGPDSSTALSGTVVPWDY